MHPAHTLGAPRSPRQLIRSHQRATTWSMTSSGTGMIESARSSALLREEMANRALAALSVARLESATAQTTCDLNVNRRSLTRMVGLER